MLEYIPPFKFFVFFMITLNQSNKINYKNLFMDDIHKSKILNNSKTHYYHDKRKTARRTYR